MTQIRSAKLIVVESATTFQLNAVHQLVMSNASAWWHHVPHTWIVGDDNAVRGATWWRDNIQPLIAPVPGLAVPTALVVALPSPGRFSRDWAYWGPNGQNEIGWILSEYQS